MPGPEEIYLAASSAYIEKDYQTAVDYFTRYLEVVKGDLETYYNRGRSYLELGEYKMAVNDFNKAIKINSYDNQSYNNLRLAYLGLGKEKTAIANFDNAIEIEPN